MKQRFILFRRRRVYYCEDVHVEDYYKWINEASRNWNSKEEALADLQQIANTLTELSEQTP